MVLAPPSPPVTALTAFGVSATPTRLPGGQGGTFQAGDLILKPTENPDEIQWLADVYSDVVQDGFRIARPQRSLQGDLVVDGWWAQQRLEGRHVSNKWQATFQTCRVFHFGVAHLRRPAFLASADDPWAVADRVAWQEAEIVIDHRLKPSVARLRALLRPVDLPEQLIHGDFYGNVLFADGLSPAIIDMSPYWRPAAFALAVTAVDAHVWWSAPLSLLEPWIANSDMTQMLVRATLRRLVEVEAHFQHSGRDIYDQVSAYQNLVDYLERSTGVTP